MNAQQLYFTILYHTLLYCTMQWYTAILLLLLVPCTVSVSYKVINSWWAHLLNLYQWQTVANNKLIRSSIKGFCWILLLKVFSSFWGRLYFQSLTFLTYNFLEIQESCFTISSAEFSSQGNGRFRIRCTLWTKTWWRSPDTKSTCCPI